MMAKKHNVIVLLSGGIDSTACINYYLTQNYKPLGLFIDYGQPVAQKEIESAKKVAEFYKIRLETLKVLLNCEFTNSEIKGRNALFLLTALTKYPNLTGILSLGIHAGVPYYDTSKQFISDMQKIFTSYSNGQIKLDAPFLKWNKPMIYQYCIDNHVPIELTYSCEKRGETPCGECNSCLDRRELNASTMHKI
jgi:7-cyano-7-deazaguanine synthase